MSRLPSKHGTIYFVVFVRGEANKNDGYYAKASNWQRALKMASDKYQVDHKGERPVDRGLLIRVYKADPEDAASFTKHAQVVCSANELRALERKVTA